MLGYLAEEVVEVLGGGRVLALQGHVLDGVLEKLGHLKADLEQLLLLLLLGQVVLKRAREHVGEEAQEDRQGKLGERHDHDDDERHQPEHVAGRAHQLPAGFGVRGNIRRGAKKTGLQSNQTAIEACNPREGIRRVGNCQ